MKHLLYIFITVAFTLCSSLLMSQLKEQTRIDSLVTVLKTAPEDTNKANIQNKLSHLHWDEGDYNPAKKYAQDALALSEKLHFKNGQGDALNNIGIVYMYQSNYPEALKMVSSGLKIREESGDKQRLASSHSTIGIIYLQQGNYPAALKEGFKTLRLIEETGDKSRIAHALHNIGMIYSNQHNYSEALKNYSQAQKIFEETGDKSNLASLHHALGIIYNLTNKQQEALKEFSAAMKLNEELNYKSWIANNHIGMGTVYYDLGKNDSALKEYTSALKINEEIGNESGMAYSYSWLGSINNKMKNYKEGKEYYSKCLKIALKNGELETIKSSYHGLAQADSGLGYFKEAFSSYQLFKTYDDSMNNEEATRKSTQEKMQYEFDKKEAAVNAEHNAEMGKQKLVRNGFVGGFAIVLLFAGIFFRQRNKINKEKKKSDALLLNILPGEVALELKNSGESKAKAFSMVTVMFTDFKDFTIISEKLNASLLVDEIHHCFSAFDNILQKYQIEKIKTIGDAYLCASGLPVTNDNHAEEILSAAFEIRDFILRRKTESPFGSLGAFELRIGIHTGPVVAGIVGIKKYAYDIWGDTVNIAARMEQNSEAGKINISGTTYELVKNKFKCEPRGKISAKNKGEIDMYFVETVS